MVKTSIALSTDHNGHGSSDSIAGVAAEASEELEPPDTRMAARRRSIVAQPTLLTYIYILLAFLASSASAQSASPSSSAAAENDGDHVNPALAALIPILVIGSGIVAGLTLGYMSLDMTQLNVLMKTGNEKQRRNASAIEPLRRDGHLLLVTLLLANMILNETLPVVADPVLGGGVQAVVVSTALVVIFAEMAWPTRILIWIFYPVAKPVAMLLTWLLGKHNGIIYRRSELKELITMHADQGGHGGDLKADTITIVGATLDLQEKTVGDAMTSLADVFMLDLDDTKLDYPTLSKILRAGYSRIPVYEKGAIIDGKHKRHIKGILLVKQCVLLDPEDATPLRDLPIHPMPVIPDDMPLLNILNAFQEGRSHLAIVAPRLPDAVSRTNTSRSNIGSKEPLVKEKERSLFRSLFKRDDSEKDALGRVEAGDDEKAAIRSSKASLLMALDEDNPLGVISLEDVIEELIGEPIADETDRAPDGSMAMQPYLPPEALEAIREESKPAAPAASAPMRPARSSLAQTLLGSRPSTPASKDSTASDPVDKRVSVLPSMPRLPKLAVARSRSAPGRKRDAAPPLPSAPITDSPLKDAPISAEMTSSDSGDKLTTLNEGSNDSASDEEGEKMVRPRRRSLDERQLPTTLAAQNASIPAMAAPPRVPGGLANAVLLERGRRQLAAQGTDLSSVSLRVAGTPTGERPSWLPPQTTVTAAPVEKQQQTGPMVSRRSAFKAPVPANIPTRSASTSTPASTDPAKPLEPQD